MERVTKEVIIGDLLQMDTGVIPILLEAGMHCIGCPSSQGESLEEACMVHGIEVDELVGQINTYFESK